MRILVINYEYPPVGGGGGRACADLAKALAARGHAVRVLTTWTPGLARELEVDGYSVRRLWTGRRSRFRASFLVMAGFIIFSVLPAIAEVRRWQPDVIHVHFGVPTGVVGVLVHLLTGKPYVLTGHLGDVPGGVSDKTDRWFMLVDPLTPPIWRQAARVVAVSEHTRSLIQNRYEVPVGVIPNGIELEKSSADPLNTPPRLIFAGRFQPQKNLIFLLQALNAMRELPWTLSLVGDGPLRAKLEASAKEFGLDDRIEFLGWVTPDQVEDLLDESDLLVMPSKSEGLPVVAVQALAHGLAMAVTEAGGLTDVVDDGVNGFKVPVGADDEYVERLRQLLTNPQILAEMKEKSLDKAKEFSLDSVASSYEAIFLEAIG